MGMLLCQDENASMISEQTARGLNRFVPIASNDFLQPAFQTTEKTVKSLPVGDSSRPPSPHTLNLLHAVCQQNCVY